VTFGPYALDAREHRLTRHGQPVALSPRPFDLLVALVTHAGRLVTREELLREVWKGTVVEQSSLNAAMSVLRQTLGDDVVAMIETVPGRGYRFIAPVGTAVDGAPAIATPAPSTDTAVRAMIVDDHAIVRLGVRALLERAPGFHVIGEAAHVDEATAAVAAQQPDLLILDLNLNGADSLEHIAKWRASAPGMRVVVLSMHHEDEHARRALAAGAHGYVMKEQMITDLAAAISEVLGGGVWVSPQVNRAILRDVVLGRPISN
jgi:DNA-binding response OmpR family regulator